MESAEKIVVENDHITKESIKELGNIDLYQTPDMKSIALGSIQSINQCIDDKTLKTLVYTENFTIKSREKEHLNDDWGDPLVENWLNLYNVNSDMAVLHTYTFYTTFLARNVTLKHRLTVARQIYAVACLSEQVQFAPKGHSRICLLNYFSTFEDLKVEEAIKDINSQNSNPISTEYFNKVDDFQVPSSRSELSHVGIRNEIFPKGICTTITNSKPYHIVAGVMKVKVFFICKILQKIYLKKC